MKIDFDRPIRACVISAADRELTFRGVLAQLEQSHPKRTIRRRLAAVINEIDGGADWAESLAGHGLIRQADRCVLQAAQRVGNLPWALREMAASSRRRLLYRLQGALQVLFVLVLIGMGMLVMIFVVGCFMPLVELITKLT